MTNWVEGFLDIEKTDILFGSALVFCWLAWRIALCNVWMFSAIPSPHLKAFCLGLTGHCSSSRFANILLKRRTSTELTVIGLVLAGSSVPFSLGINVVLLTQSSEGRHPDSNQVLKRTTSSCHGSPFTDGIMRPSGPGAVLLFDLSSDHSMSSRVMGCKLFHAVSWTCSAVLSSGLEEVSKRGRQNASSVSIGSCVDLSSVLHSPETINAAAFDLSRL